MTTFHAPAHAEDAIIEANERRRRHERFLRSWANDDRAINVAIRSGTIGAQAPGDAAVVLGAEEAGLPLDDPQLNSVLEESMRVARNEDGALWNGDPRTDDSFDWSFNPMETFGEGLQWWSRGPGEQLGAAFDVPENIALKGMRGASRWFMLGADAAIDSVTDRIYRSMTDAFRETGVVDMSPLQRPLVAPEFLKEFGKEYFTGEDIGNKAFYGALGELFAGRPVNIGSGWLPESELAPDVQVAYEKAQQVSEDYKGQIEAAYEDRANPEGWWQQQSRTASPHQESVMRSTQIQERMLNDAVSMSPEQAELGRPVVQQSRAKQEAYMMPLRPTLWTNNDDPYTGNPSWSQVSGGRIIANLVTEPGTKTANALSGTLDFAKQIFLDPLNIVGAGMFDKGADAVKLTKAGEELAGEARHLDELTKLINRGGEEVIEAARTIKEAPTIYQRGAIATLKNAGIDVTKESLEKIRAADFIERTDEAGVILRSRARLDIDPGKANRFLTGAQAQPTVEALAKSTTMKQVNQLLSGIKGATPSRMAAELKDAMTEGDVIEVMTKYLPEIDFRGVMKRTAGLPSYTWKEMVTNLPDLVDDVWSLRPRTVTGPVSAVTEAGRLGLDVGFTVVDRLTDDILNGMWKLTGGAGNAPLPGVRTRATLRTLYGSTWIGRMVNDASNKQIRTDNIDIGYKQTLNFVRNFGLDEDDIVAKTKKGKIIVGKTLDEIKSLIEKGDSLGVDSVFSVDDALYDFARLGNGNGSGARDAVRQIFYAARYKMIDEGIDPVFANAVTSMADDMGWYSKFFVDATGEVANYPGTGFMGLIDGKVSLQPGPQLIHEMYHGAINVPDPRILRRTLAEKHAIGRVMNQLTTQRKIVKVKNIFEDGILHPSLKGVWEPKGTLYDNAAARMARAFISKIWKPLKILRFGYVPKVILGDEQGRMTAAGLSSMWAPGRVTEGDSPLAYFAYMFANWDGKIMRTIRKGAEKVGMSPTEYIDVKGVRLQAAAEYIDNVSLHGNAFGEVGAYRSEMWGKVHIDDQRYTDGLATEINQLAEDPIVQKMFSPEFRSTDTVAATEHWLLNDPEGQRLLNVITKKIAEQDPITAETFRNGGEMLHNYVQWVYARAHLKTGGDYIFRDPNTGTLFSSARIELNPNDFPDVGDGITIIREGHDGLLNSLHTGSFGADELGEGGTKVRSLSDKAYKKLRKELDKIIKESRADIDGGVQFPEFVKYDMHPNTYNPQSIAGKVTEFLMDGIVSKPAEKLNRAPVFFQLYWQSIAESLPYMSDDLAELTLKRAETAGIAGRVRAVSDDIIEQLGHKPEAIIDSFDDLDMYAKSFAAEGLKDLLFDFSSRKNMFDALSLITPFGDAWLELFTAWGKLFAKNPTLYRRPAKAYDELQRTNPFDELFGEYDVTDNGFFFENEYGEEVFAIPASAAFARAVNKGINAVGLGSGETLPETEWTINLSGLNMIATQLYPGFGPIVTIPAASVIPNTPEFYGLRDFLAPFGMGENSIEEAINQSIAGSPSLRRFINAYTGGKFLTPEDERMFATTKQYILDEMITSGEATLEDLNDPDKNQEIQTIIEDRTQNLYLVRSFAQFLMPAAPNAPKIMFTQEEFDALPDHAKPQAMAMQDAARTYYDILSKEAGNNSKKATEIFMDRYGFDPLISLVSKYETEGKHGVTTESLAFEQYHQDLFNQFPMTAYYLQPDTEENPFDYRAWKEQFLGGTREVKDVGQRIDDYIIRSAAIEYARGKEEIRRQIDSGEFPIPEGMSRSAIEKKALDLLRRDIEDRNPAYFGRPEYTDDDLTKAVSELRTWRESDKLRDNATQEAVTRFFDEVWDPATLMLEEQRGSSRSTPLPFMNAGSQMYTSSGNLSESWLQRAAINQWVIDSANAIAAEEGSGHFFEIWDELLSRTVYDYFGGMEKEVDIIQQNKEIDDEIERVFGG